MSELQNQTVSYHVRCLCKFCEHCTYKVSIYDECEFCYEGKHPSLVSIARDFERHLEKKWDMWPETKREEIPVKSSKLSNFIRHVTKRRNSNGC